MNSFLISIAFWGTICLIVFIFSVRHYKNHPTKRMRLRQIEKDFHSKKHEPTAYMVSPNYWREKSGLPPYHKHFYRVVGPGEPLYRGATFRKIEFVCSCGDLKYMIRGSAPQLQFTRVMHFEGLLQNRPVCGFYPSVGFVNMTYDPHRVTCPNCKEKISPFYNLKNEDHHELDASFADRHPAFHDYCMRIERHQDVFP